MDWFNETVHCIAAAGVLLGVLVKPWDRNRVRQAIIRKGGNITRLETGTYNISWLLGDKTIHEVEYADGKGEIHLAEVTTSLLVGVRFVSDVVMPRARFLRKSHAVLPSVVRKRAAIHYHADFPSGLPVDEERKPRPRLARSE